MAFPHHTRRLRRESIFRSLPDTHALSHRVPHHESVADPIRLLKRRPLCRRMDVPIPSTPLAEPLLRCRSRVRGNVECQPARDARAWPRPLQERSSATRLRPRLQEWVADRRFFCAQSFATSTQPFFLHSATSPAVSHLVCGVEAAGIEPASADAPVRTSTSIGRDLSLARTAGSRPTYRRASHPEVSHLRRLALRRCQPVR